MIGTNESPMKPGRFMVIYYKNSGVVGKRMYGTSDPYPASDFPILEVAEFNKRL